MTESQSPEEALEACITEVEAKFAPIRALLEQSNRTGEDAKAARERAAALENGAVDAEIARRRGESSAEPDALIRQAGEQSARVAVLERAALQTESRLADTLAEFHEIEGEIRHALNNYANAVVSDFLKIFDQVVRDAREPLGRALACAEALSAHLAGAAQQVSAHAALMQCAASEEATGRERMRTEPAIALLSEVNNAQAVAREAHRVREVERARQRARDRGVRGVGGRA